MIQKKSKISVKQKLCEHCQNPLKQPIGKKRFHTQCQKDKKQKYDNACQKRLYNERVAKVLLAKKKRTNKENLKLLSLVKNIAGELESELSIKLKVLEQDKQPNSIWRDGEKYATEQQKYNKKRQELRLRVLINDQLNIVLSNLIGIKK